MSTRPNLSGSANLTIPAYQRWNYNGTWTARCDDESGTVIGLGIDFGVLNPDYPQPGTYTITYVAMGGCTQSGTTVQTRIITVN